MLGEGPSKNGWSTACSTLSRGGPWQFGPHAVQKVIATFFDDPPGGMIQILCRTKRYITQHSGASASLHHRLRDGSCTLTFCSALASLLTCESRQYL